MAIFNFFKAPKVRQYHHEYIYYDPDKEEREERLKRVREQIANEKNDSQPRMLRYGVFQEQRKTGNGSNSAKSREIKLVVMVVVAAVLLFVCLH